MDTDNSSSSGRAAIRSLALIAVLLASVGASGTALAQSELSVGVDAPSEATVGDETTVSASVSVPDVIGSHEAELTVTAFVDGEQVATRTVTIQDGEKTTVSFGHAFESGGSHAVKVEAGVTVAGQTFSGSGSTTVTAVAPTTDRSSTVETPMVETTSVEGAAFSVPDSLQDEVNAYREQASQNVEGHAFVLATTDSLYVVFTQSKPKKGVATVEGVALEKSISAQDLTFGVIAATSASFETSGTKASVEEVAQNSGEYRLDLVRTTATHRRVASLTDPDAGNGFTASATTGVLVESPKTASSMFSSVGQTARGLSHDPETSEVDSALTDPRKPHLHTVSFEKTFWTDAEATVDAIVLDPSSAAYQYVQTFDHAGIARAEDGAPILYVVNRDVEPRSMDGVASVKERASSLDGEVVSFEARMHQQTVSPQEVLEENSGCGDEKLQVEKACVNVAQDALLHGGVAWNEVPQSPEDVLLVMGVSSRHQDAQQKLRTGRYRIVGEVVSTSRIDSSLPEGSVLLVYDLERVADIDYGAVADESRAIIENRTDGMVARFRSQVSGDATNNVTDAANESTRGTVSAVTPEKTAAVAFDPNGNASVAVSEVRLNATKKLEDVKIQVSDAGSVPDSVSAPPTEPVRLLNVSASASDSAIADATIEMQVDKSTVDEGSQLVAYRYHDGSWQELDVTVAAESETEIVLRVRTPGFSYFAVGTTTDDENAKQATDAAGTETGSEADRTEGKSVPDTGIPGFGAGTAIVAIVALFGWRTLSR